MVDSLLSTPTMVSVDNYWSRCSPCSLSRSTANQQSHQLTPIQMPTIMSLLRLRRLPPALRKVAIPLAVGPDLAVLLAALVIVVLHTAVVRGAPRLLGAHLMHLLCVFGFMAVVLFYLPKLLFRPLIRVTCLVSLA